VDSGLRGKRAIVTGGSNGIGKAIANGLEAEGAAVQIFDLESDPPVDVADRASIDAALAVAGTPDIVIANAGMVREAEFLDHSAGDWERVLAVNLTGVFHTVQAAARLMKPRRAGAIVITASTNSYDGEARLSA
jgi:NAD(P)-dependent dehydrogenase (short-subunit alcohol dehydrogenase family)